MKYVKYQQDLLKGLLSDKPIRGYIGHENENVLVTMDGCLMVSIPDCLWYLDVRRTRGEADTVRWENLPTVR